MSAQSLSAQSLDEFRAAIPEWAKDIALNLGSVLSVEGAPDLTPNQIAGTALASAYATKNAELIAVVTQHAVSMGLDEAGLRGACAAAAIMGMNNIYYRFIHLVPDPDIKALPARLRMNIIAQPGIPKVDFELYSLAVSAINGCGMCLETHTHEIAKNGVSKTGIQSAIRIAAVINAAAQVLAIQ